MASTIVPAALLARRESAEFALLCSLGALFGAISVLALLGAVGLDGPMLTRIAPLAAGLLAFSVLVRASVRARRRAAWLDRVRKGDEPDLRVRPLDLRDPVAALPRLGVGNTVVEWCPAVPDTSAYRQHTVLGTAVAVIADQA